MQNRAMSVEILLLPKTALHWQVVHQLRQMLLENLIEPGTKLNERELSKLLNVSRTPLREAIKMLAAEGLVELLPNRGAIALELSEVDIINTFEVMAGLEAQSGELAAQRITDAEVAVIQALHSDMLVAYDRRDLSTYYRLNASIHRAINVAAKNPILTATYNQVNARLQALRFRSNQDGDNWSEGIRDHKAMLDALIARDPAALRAVLVKHLMNKREVVIAQLRTAPLVPVLRSPCKALKTDFLSQMGL